MPTFPYLFRSLSSVPSNVRGALWMLFAAASFTVVVSSVRAMAGTVHPFEIAFFRTLFILMFMLPTLRQTGLSIFRTRRWGTYLARSVTGVATMAAWFTALQILPIADATALNFTSPLFAIAGGAVILHESGGPRRWVAVVVGFFGALIIIRPGIQVISAGAMIALLAAVLASTIKLYIKSLARTETPSAQVFVTAMLTTILALIPALFVWTQPPPEAWPLLILAGLGATGVQLGTAKAMALADLSAVVPFDFSRLVFAALAGFVLFGEVPDVWTWVGAAIIFTSAFYAALHQKRTVAAGPDDPPKKAKSGAGDPLPMGPTS